MNKIEIKQEQQIDGKAIDYVLNKNRALAQRAGTSITKVIDTLPPDVSKLELYAGDQLEKSVNELRVKAVDSIKLNKDRRMVFTRQMDAIKSMFTAEEKAIDEALQKLVNWSNDWNAEKRRRQAEEEKKRQAEMAHENAKIDLVKFLNNELNDQYSNLVAQYIERMNAKFYKCNALELGQYAMSLQQYVPKTLGAMDMMIGFDKPALLTTQESETIRKSVFDEQVPVLAKEFKTRLAAEVGRLLELVPSRTAELERIADDAREKAKADARIKAEADARKAQLAKEAEAAKENIIEDAAAAKMDVAFEQAAIAPAATVTKGTQVKLKYDVQNHQQMIKIISWWVANELALLTVDDMTKKLSFMRTAASNALNKGEKIEGIPTVEDVRTRTNRK